MDLARLLAIVPPEPPDDFSAFWRSRYASALKVAPQPKIQATGQMLAGHAVYDLSYASTDGVQIGGWLLVAGPGSSNNRGRQSFRPHHRRWRVELGALLPRM
ncbi:MAG: hypothetical protein B7Y41_07730 [Hydrogenophilales bacterium 28-61-23]|nr:MAG: hypothetical protein B7Y41_07730 [Hydrogenophilales bacterium 28-61-23]